MKSQSPKKRRYAYRCMLICWSSEPEQDSIRADFFLYAQFFNMQHSIRRKLEAKTSKRRWHGSVLVFRKQCCHPFPQSAFVRLLLLENCFGSGIATAWCSLRGQEMSLFEIQTSTCVLHLVHVLGCFDFATHYATLKGTPNRKADMAEDLQQT